VFDRGNKVLKYGYEFGCV